MGMTPLLALTLSAALAASAPSSPSAPASPAPATFLTAQAAQVATQLASASSLNRHARRGFTQQRDSLANGAKYGAIAGGLAMGGFVAYMCVMFDDTEGKGDCVAATALWAGLGAAGGAAIGVGIDALFDRPAVNLRVRF